MKFCLIVSLGVAVGAFPQGPRNDYPVVGEWRPASESDSRSPCPMLNTLANHGYLPRNGRNITAKGFGKAIHEGLGFNITAGEDQANLQLQALGKQVVDLEELNAHEVLEHRASLTRDDFPGDTIHNNPSRLEAMLADSSTDYLDINSFAKSRVRVEALTAPLTTAHIQMSAGEAGLFILALTSGLLPVNGTNFDELTVPKDRARAWLTLEKLPVDFGWKPARRQYVFGDVFGLTGAILALRSSLLSQ
ncbi:hypothetical protein HYFRA_00009598 [Hymenoscyphus fraxineus]|uniref:Heme haloperoxidase family profile domain-containing protein n=1 Tax=Hymenoscyphus fraxineus TaxID=746836 RepID=A0A9N9KY52_9HELO|nr:hypothetical protein HYFRA_00009598 [Hymenoscyphus fraxineus]